MGEQLNYKNFNSIQLMLASPEDVKNWSYGEVKKPETINYRTFKAEKDGLFCEKIFGPIKDYECNCGRYKYPRHEGVVCERCGVEVTKKEVRRERMGHIELAVPVAHIWYVRQPPSMIGKVLNLKRKYVEEIAYYASYIITGIENDIFADIKLIDNKKIASHDVEAFNERRYISVINAETYNKIQAILKELKELYGDFRKSFISGDIMFFKTFVNEVYKEPLYRELQRKIAENIYNADKFNSLYDLWANKFNEIEGYLDVIESNLKVIDETEAGKSDIFTEYFENVVDCWEVDDYSGLIENTQKVLENTEDKKITKSFEDILNICNKIVAVEEKLRESINGKIKALIKETEKNLKVEPALKGEIGGEGLYSLLKDEFNPKKIAASIRKKLKLKKTGKGKSRRLRKRLKIVEYFINSGNKAEYMMLKRVPVIPPDLRPLVPLKGGKFASSDLNDLYRRIINRNKRLKDIIEIGAPDVMLHNEKRLLQESVDTLIQNGVRNKTVRGPGRRPLKSLSENIKGKQGRFRRNLLGKRVDYSGRSVIVVGPNLKLSQCGLPKEMAVELYKPFILRGLMKKGYAANAKAARRLLEQEVPVVYDILATITKDHPVLLNRAPTLHRLSIQAFEPVLVEGKAIQLHPLVCAGFNADFDGDQMAVHVPISPEACMEAKLMVMAVNNIISPAHGDNIMTSSQDMVMGCNYITREKRGVKGEGMIFSNRKEVEYAQQSGTVDINARIKVSGLNKIREDGVSRADLRNPDKWKDYTTVGRVIFNELLPEGFEFLNEKITKKILNQQVAKCFWEFSKYETVKFLDRIKKFGFKCATTSGISLSIDDMEIPEYKKLAIEEAEKKVEKILENYHKGYITTAEKSNGIIDIWSQVTDRVADAMIGEIEAKNSESYDPANPKFNPLQLMASSGARGSIDQVRQLAGVRGLMSRSGTGGSGEVIEQPIKSNFREGLSVFEYYISTHGGRKGLTDTALKTAEAGHLTRRLIDVTHNVIITEEDCNTVRGINVSAIRDTETNEEIEGLADRIYGRITLSSIADPLTDEVIIKEGELISREVAERIVSSEITGIRVRSPITCESKNGICRKCYGADLSTGSLARVGMAVGIIAAQSIGEPGTQLTLRTFHVGGTASNISQAREIRAEIEGLIRFEDIKTITDESNRIINISRKGKIEIKGKQEGEVRKDNYDVRYGAVLHKKASKTGVKVKKGEIIAEWEPFSTPIIAEQSGTVKYVDIEKGINAREEINQKTGRTELVIVPYIGGAKGSKKNYYPHIALKNKKGEIKKYPLQIDALLTATIEEIDKGKKVKIGEELARIPLKEIKTRDITSGLPRVIELFEARPPKNSAVVSEIEGRVSLGHGEKKTSGALMVTVTPPKGEGLAKTYKIPPGKHLEVIDGSQVRDGDALTDGAVDTHDILDVKGYKAVQEFLVNEIQSVYRLQGVDVNDKHIEIVIRQMLSFVQITASGNTTFQEKEVVKKTVVDRCNKELGPDKEPARYQPKLLGISKASLNSESFISAASFERTTKVLTQAAVSGQVDYLRGLKENVIVGKLIPVGTGQLKEEA